MAAWSLGGLLETPPRWHVTILYFCVKFYPFFVDDVSTTNDYIINGEYGKVLEGSVGSTILGSEALNVKESTLVYRIIDSVNEYMRSSQDNLQRYRHNLLLCLVG